MADKSSRLTELVSKEAFHWGENVRDAYHGVASSHMDAQWTDIISRYFGEYKFDLTQVIDFAAGYGRNTRKLLETGAGHITAVDVNPDCVKALQSGLDPARVDVIQNSGSDLGGLSDHAYSFFYSFDAMVHFDLEIIIAYLPEFFRVLKPGAFALVHHSNYSGNPGGDFREKPHWRNFMTADLFKHIAIKSGFDIVRQDIFAWGDPNVDCMTLMRKP